MDKLSNETIDNLKYILSHKYHIYNAGREIDLPRWQLFKHDFSKLLPSEFFPYKHHFFSDTPPSPKDEKFQEASSKHKQRNPHHPEYWQTRGKQMPQSLRLEMVADWYASGKAQNSHRFQTFKSWFSKNKDRLNISDQTRKDIEERLKK